MLRYWAALDGLRGLAVLAVMLFHAHVPFSRGGFLGVDVFFVLSGFLITSQLLREIEQHGKVSWPSFFKRRLVRLQPALMLLLLAYAIAWASGLIPTSGVTTARDIVTVLLAWAHWARAFDWHPPDYLGHTWSLGIEEQFYLLWAALFAAAGSKLSRPWRLALLSMTGALVSTGWMHWLQANDASPARLYNGLDTRAMGLLWGCALAALLHGLCPGLLEPIDHNRVNTETRRVGARYIRLMADNAAWICLGLLVVAIVVADWRAPLMFRWGYSVIAILTCILLAALVVTPDSTCSHFLGFAPLASLGKISYGLYLWHYPMLRIFETQAPVLGLEHRTALTVALLLSVLAAFASYLWLELPLKRKLFGKKANPSVPMPQQP